MPIDRLTRASLVPPAQRLGWPNRADSTGTMCRCPGYMRDDVNVSRLDLLAESYITDISGDGTGCGEVCDKGGLNAAGVTDGGMSWGRRPSDLGGAAPWLQNW